MKILSIFLFLPFLFSCSSKSDTKYDSPKTIVIYGKINNYDRTQNEISIYPNRLGYSQKTIYSKIDKNGKFSVSFESYIPTDVWFNYKTNFLILSHPGDSIYVELDVNTNKQDVLLNGIIFKGDASKLNQEASVLQKIYSSNDFVTNWNHKDYAVSKYDLKKYLLFLDTLKQVNNSIYKEFIKKASPGKEAKIWAKEMLLEDYYDAYALYPELHKKINHLTTQNWKIPVKYYDKLLEKLPISKASFISGNVLSSFINQFYVYYANNNIVAHTPNFNKLPKSLRDSILIFGYVKYTPDTLLRQMVLTEFLNDYFESSQIKLYEKYKNVFDKYIQEPFLKEPITEMYFQTKYRLENTKKQSNNIIKSIEKLSIKNLFEKIRRDNKGKIVYVDCWATWCSACRSEIPQTNKLMNEMKDNKVSFVYLCLNSDETVWKATLEKYKMKGQQYLLDKPQSKELTKVLSIQGIPFYFIMDRNGNIIEKGSYLTPKVAKKRIEKLIRN